MLWALEWMPNGKGWLTTHGTGMGNQLVYIHPDGTYSNVGNIEGWAKPSPDGKHITFLNDRNATNAWVFERP